MLQSVIATAREESVYLPVMARVLKVEQMTALEKLFTLQLPGGRSLGNDPGQFVECSLMGIGEAPISISSSPSRSNGTFELCIRRVGDLTGALHNLEPGDVVATGTPSGIAPMKEGDIVEVEVDGVGNLRNQVVRAR